MTESSVEQPAGRLRLPSFPILLLGALGVLAMLWIAPTIAAFVSSIDLAEVDNLYGIIAGFVILDAVIPIFPSESLLTTASNLAAQDGSGISLWKLIAAGTVGAVIGDSILYWLSRTVLRKRMSAQVERAQQNEKISRAMDVMSGTAPMLIVFGRFVPGLRFMIGATMGLTRFPYRRFLMWDAIGGFFWAAYTCVFCYLVASIIDDKPFVSIVVSVVVTTGLLALLYRPLKRQWEETGSGDDPVVAPAGTD